MARSFWDDIEPPGTVEVDYKLVQAITAGHRRGAEMYVLYRSVEMPLRTAPKPANDRAAAGDWKKVFVKFSYIRRPHIDRPAPPSVRAGKRVVLYPAITPERRLVKAAKAKRHGKLGVHTIRKELLTPDLARFVGPKAKARFFRIVNRRAAPPSAAARYQRYIDGPIKARGSKSATRILEINGSPCLLGNIGTDRAERAKFWTESVARLTRANARFQYRIVLALPASFTPDEKRAAVQEFARRLFEPYGIRWSAVIHKRIPGGRAEDGEDHAHILFEPLGTDQMRELKKRGDRVYLRLGWTEIIKEKAAEAFNDVYWRKDRRIGLKKGTAIFEPGATVRVPRGTVRSRENPNLWRVDEKRERVGLATTAQRKARSKTGLGSRWMNVAHFVAVIEKIAELLPFLIPQKVPANPTIDKALRHLRDWAERLVEAIFDEIRQTHEVATYLSLPVGAKPSELLEQVFDRFRGIDWSRSAHRFDYLNGYEGLLDDKARPKGFKGPMALEYKDTIIAIQEVEGASFSNVIDRRRKLAACHGLMVRALWDRQMAIDALTDTIRYLEGQSPASLRQNAIWWPYASMAADGIGVVRQFSRPEIEVYVEDGDLPRKAAIEAKRELTFAYYRREQDDPWLRAIGERHNARVKALWTKAIAERRDMEKGITRSMFEIPVDRSPDAGKPIGRPAPPPHLPSPLPQSDRPALARPAHGLAERSSPMPQQQSAVQVSPTVSQPTPADQPLPSDPKADVSASQKTGTSVADAIASIKEKTTRGRDDRSR